MNQPDPYAALAAVVLSKCAAYDPYLTEPTEEQARAWGEQFARFGLNDQALLLEAVTEVYAANGSGFRPLPKDITDAARKIRSERIERETEEERDRRQSARDLTREEQFGSVEITDGLPMTVEEAKRSIRRDLARFGKKPGAATNQVQDRLRERARAQRQAAPPQPFTEGS